MLTGYSYSKSIQNVKIIMVFSTENESDASKKNPTTSKPSASVRALLLTPFSRSVAYFALTVDKKNMYPLLA